MNSPRESIPTLRRLRPGQCGLPLDRARAFGRRAPLVIEIGFGNATFLGEMAGANPQWDFLGVEIATASITRGVGLLRRNRLENARVICADGRFVLREMCGPHSVHRIYVNFPDPWPKERHLDRRLLQEPWLRLVSTRLEHTGELWLTTDHGEYFEYALEQTERTGLFDVLRPEAPEAALRTKYARRWQEQRKCIHHAVLRPRRTDDDPHAPLLELVEMAHARLRGNLDAIDAFEKQVHHTDLGHIVLMDLSRCVDGSRLHFQVIVDEADLRQELLIEARPAGSGNIYVELMQFGSPAVTRGVRRAVEHVADWLAAHGLQRLDDGSATP